MRLRCIGFHSLISFWIHLGLSGVGLDNTTPPQHYNVNCICCKSNRNKATHNKAKLIDNLVRKTSASKFIITQQMQLVMNRIKRNRIDTCHLDKCFPENNLQGMVRPSNRPTLFMRSYWHATLLLNQRTDRSVFLSLSLPPNLT